MNHCIKRNWSTKWPGQDGWTLKERERHQTKNPAQNQKLNEAASRRTLLVPNNSQAFCHMM